MANKEHVPPILFGDKREGIIWFLIGAALLGIGIGCFRASWEASGWGLPVFVISISGIAAGSTAIVTGIVLFFFLRKREKRKQLTGKVLFWIWIIGFVISIAVMFEGCSRMTNMDDPEHFGIVIMGFFILIGTFPILVLGAILYFVGRSQEKKQKTLHEADDSHSDYNKPVKKSRL